MKDFSRRDLLKTGLIAPAVAAAHGMGPLGNAIETGDQKAALQDNAAETTTAGHSQIMPTGGAERERLLLDFGWRFHLGHANDTEKDFAFGTEGAGTFQKTGNFLPAGANAFDDSEWKALNLPHDWAIELPFTNDQSLQSKGFYPLGRKYPETSVGWYRRVFDLPVPTRGNG